MVLLKTAIEMLGGVVRFHVPHRLLEGYGLQSSVLEAAYAEGVRLVITVDTGMRAFAEAETARRLGLDLIITDHHLLKADDSVPAALAILNPNQPGCGYPEKSLCGAAIALKLAQALLERRDPVRTREKTLPSFLKMAAIATIADAVPLHGENRAIAALGLRELRRPVGAGLRALFAAAALDPAGRELTGFDVAFRLAPRINAAGRMDVASEVVELFCTRDVARANELATKLELLNRQRRDTEAAALTIIEVAPGRRCRVRRLLPAGGRWRRMASRRDRHPGFAGGGTNCQAGHRGERRRRSGARLGPLGRRLSTARSHRDAAAISSRALGATPLRWGLPCPPMGFRS